MESFFTEIYVECLEEYVKALDESCLLKPGMSFQNLSPFEFMNYHANYATGIQNHDKEIVKEIPYIIRRRALRSTEQTLTTITMFLHNLMLYANLSITPNDDLDDQTRLMAMNILERRKNQFENREGIDDIIKELMSDVNSSLSQNTTIKIKEKVDGLETKNLENIFNTVLSCFQGDPQGDDVARDLHTSATTLMDKFSKKINDNKLTEADLLKSAVQFLSKNVPC